MFTSTKCSVVRSKSSSLYKPPCHIFKKFYHQMHQCYINLPYINLKVDVTEGLLSGVMKNKNTKSSNSKCSSNRKNRGISCKNQPAVMQIVLEVFENSTRWRLVLIRHLIFTHSIILCLSLVKTLRLRFTMTLKLTSHTLVHVMWPSGSKNKLEFIHLPTGCLEKTKSERLHFRTHSLFRTLLMFSCRFPPFLLLFNIY